MYKQTRQASCSALLQRNSGQHLQTKISHPAIDMAMPLSPRSENILNIVPCITDSATKPKAATPSKRLTVPDENTSASNSVSSSPFQTEIGTDVGQENKLSLSSSISPSKKTMSRPKGQDFAIYMDTDAPTTPPLPPSDIKSSVYKDSFEKDSSPSPSKVPLPPSSPFKDVLDDPALNNSPQRNRREEPTYVDDCDAKSVASDDTGFTAFSAVPDMTIFAKLGNQTPGRGGRSPKREDQTPSSHVFMTPATSRRQALACSRPGSPTPRATHVKDGDTTNLLLDFTQQFEGIPRRNTSPTKSVTEPNLLQHINSQRMPSPAKTGVRTPGRKSMLNLLDFDLPPQPTPRSIPTITVRELESLKSQYLSEISSLKASLSGREAEVVSLKKAVGDAERRVGEAQETLRDERSAREHADNLKVEWEKKGKEVETALRKFKEEFLAEEKEKEELLQKLDEANQARQEAELKAAEATRNASVAQSDFDGKASNPAATDAIVAQKVAAQLDEKMENLARELHQVYKKKHESKVASLKKNYEIRAEKKCAELQTRIDELTKQNDDLQAVKESTLSIELPKDRQVSSASEESQRLLEEQKSQLQQYEATIAGLKEEMSSVRQGHAALVRDLERERVEKGELVAAVDEMLALQAEAPPGTPRQTALVEDFRRSISGASRAGSAVSVAPPRATTPGSGLGLGESRIGRGGPGLPMRSASGGKSTMRSNIERMGHSGR